MPEFQKKTPGAIESHWIPTDPELWKVENYRDFLAARRELLAAAANTFLDSLLVSQQPAEPVAEPVLERTAPPHLLEAEHPAFTEEEERIVRECNDWVRELGLPEGEVMHEAADPSTGEPLAVFDLAWPDGLQAGLSQPVALLIEEGDDTEAVANRLGYRFFTALPDFKRYVEREIMALHADAI